MFKIKREMDMTLSVPYRYFYNPNKCKCNCCIEIDIFSDYDVIILEDKYYNSSMLNLQSIPDTTHFYCEWIRYCNHIIYMGNYYVKLNHIKTCYKSIYTYKYKASN
jgi:hypothetical protein